LKSNKIRKNVTNLFTGILFINKPTFGAIDPEKAFYKPNPAYWKSKYE